MLRTQQSSPLGPKTVRNSRSRKRQPHAVLPASDLDHQRTRPSNSLFTVICVVHFLLLHSLAATKRILRYVRGTIQFGIHYSAKATPLLVGFTDSDWAGDPDDRRSTAGYVFTLGSGPITWACKKQAAISLSSAEAEYRDAVEASKEALWLRQILSELGFEQQHPTTLWCDNQSAIQLCKDPVQHKRSKHIELHMHFIRKLIHDHVLEVQYCSTDDQVADIFTKALTEAKFTKLRYMLGVQEVLTKGG
eukprot:PITA_16085